MNSVGEPLFQIMKLKSELELRNRATDIGINDYLQKKYFRFRYQR
jgi:hypothetical protein